MLQRRHVVTELLKDRNNAVVVTGLGSPTYDVAAVSPSERNFYLWGAMGGAAMMGFGLALAKPDLHVIVVTGDGESLMGMVSSQSRLIAPGMCPPRAANNLLPAYSSALRASQIMHSGSFSESRTVLFSAITSWFKLTLVLTGVGKFGSDCTG